MSNPFDRSVTSREELASFVEQLRSTLVSRSEVWENNTLDAFLEAMQAWIHDSPGYFRNQGIDEPDRSTYALVSMMLGAAESSLGRNREVRKSDTLDDFLEGLGAWIRDSAGYFRNQGVDEPGQSTWALAAMALSAARSYE